MMGVGYKKKVQNIETLETMAKKRSQWGDIWRRMKKNKLAMVGLVIIIILILSAVFADQISPYDYTKQDVSNRLQFPSLKHPLGTDNFGRDLLSRVIQGGRTSLLVALLALVISLIVGGFFGATAGYFGGWYETTVMRIMDIIMAIPSILLAVSISAALGTGTVKTAIAIAITGIPSAARIVRSSVLSLKDQEFVEAAIATGSSHMRTIFHQILPNTLAPLIVDSTLRLGGNILAISGLSFVGLGVQPPQAEWGSIMTAGRDYIRDFWPLTTFPGIAIMLTLFGFNVLGDGLRDALDPKLKQ